MEQRNLFEIHSAGKVPKDRQSVLVASFPTTVEGQSRDHTSIMAKIQCWSDVLKSISFHVCCDSARRPRSAGRSRFFTRLAGKDCKSVVILPASLFDPNFPLLT